MVASKSPRRSWLPPLCVLALVSFLYGVYLLLVLLPQLRRLRFLQPEPTPPPARLADDPHMHPASAGELVALALALHALLALFVASFFQALSTPPGGVPRGDARWERGEFGIGEQDERQLDRVIRDTDTDLAQPHVRALLRRMPVVERKKGAGRAGSDEESPLAPDADDHKRKCHACMVYKPDRVHHCSVCGQCVLRMDHHCPWIANCVGFRNYKYFLLVLVYGVLTLGVLVAALLPRFLNVFAPILDPSYFLRRDLLIAIAFGVSALLLLVLGAFLCFHLWLVGGAMSTIEYREKRGSSDAAVKHRWAVAHVKYDAGGVYANFKHVLGEPYMWLFPVDPRPHDDGTYASVEQAAGGPDAEAHAAKAL